MTSVAEHPTVSRPVLTAQRLMALAIATVVVPTSLRATVDPDMWWHLPTGDEILSGGWPDGDIFSHTVPGRDWTTHEWLSQVVMELVHRAGGFAGLMVFFSVLALTVCGIVYRTSRMLGAGPLFAATVTLIVSRTSLVAWGSRPQLFNVALAAATVALIEAVRRGRVPATRLWVLVPVSLIWANLHSGFYVGVAIVVTYAVGDIVDARFRRDAPRLDVATARRLLTIAAAMLLAAVVNPAGPRLWVYPFETLASTEQRSLIAEWKPPDFGETTWWPFLVMMILGVVALAYSNTRVAVTDLLMFGGTAVAGLVSLRHVSLFAVIAAPVIVRHALSALRDTSAGGLADGSSDQPVRSPATGVVLVVALMGAAAFGSVNRIADNDEVIADTVPAAALDAALDAELDEGNVFNTYSFGGYLVWRGVDVFVDGRADVYGDEMLSIYSEAEFGRAGWAEVLDDFDVSWTLLRTESVLVTLLDADDDWERVYADDIAVVHERTG